MVHFDNTDRRPKGVPSPICVPLEEADDINKFGSKAATLSGLLRNNFPVPRGFVLSKDIWIEATEVYRATLESDETSGLPKTVRFPDHYRSLLQYSLNQLESPLLAVRSSGVGEDSVRWSFAGLFKSVIGVPNQLLEVEQAILEVWGSDFAERVAAYTNKFDLEFPVPMAVIIQKMVPAKAAGVCFTQDPNDPEFLLIEATYGLAQPLVTGKIKPDRYIMARKDLSILNSSIAKKRLRLFLRDDKLVKDTTCSGEPSLSPSKCRSIADLCLSIEKYLGHPQDIEWALDGEKIWVVQSRPITGLIRKTEKVLSGKSKVVLRGLGASHGYAKGAANVVKRTSKFEVEKNCILVAPMTDPNMVLAMSKAAGIITDRGGMICHAAILSREFGIPCVVGTGNATSVLHSGQTVEVNGYAGEIRIIEDNKPLGIKEKPVARTATQITFKIFGRSVPVRYFPLEHTEPWIKENWEGPWYPIRRLRKAEWVPPRPEIIATPLTQSIVMPAIEKLPNILKLGTKQLLTSLRRCVIHIELTSLKDTTKALKRRILGLDEAFISSYMQNVLKDYRMLENANRKITQAVLNTDNLDRHELMKSFLNWWVIHDRFFARTYLIQQMGDDVVWPEIEKEVSHSVALEKTAKIIQKLLLPTKLTISSKFTMESLDLLSKASSQIKEIFFSNISQNSAVSLILRSPGGKTWLNELRRFTQRWQWMRERDLYFPSLDNYKGMLEHLRQNLDKNVKAPEFEANEELVEEAIGNVIRTRKVDSARFRLLIKFGRFLNLERDNHFHRWLEATHTARRLIMEFGRSLTNEDFLEQPRDVFFLFLWELLHCLRGQGSRINTRANVVARKVAFCHASSVTLESVGLSNSQLLPASEAAECYW